MYLNNFDASRINQLYSRDHTHFDPVSYLSLRMEPSQGMIRNRILSTLHHEVFLKSIKTVILFSLDKSSLRHLTLPSKIQVRACRVVNDVMYSSFIPCGEYFTVLFMTFMNKIDFEHNILTNEPEFLIQFLKDNCQDVSRNLLISCLSSTPSLFTWCRLFEENLVQGKEFYASSANCINKLTSDGSLICNGVQIKTYETHGVDDSIGILSARFLGKVLLSSETTIQRLYTRETIQKLSVATKVQEITGKKYSAIKVYTGLHGCSIKDEKLLEICPWKRKDSNPLLTENVKTLIRFTVNIKLHIKTSIYREDKSKVSHKIYDWSKQVSPYNPFVNVFDFFSAVINSEDENPWCSEDNFLEFDKEEIILSATLPLDRLCLY